MEYCTQLSRSSRSSSRSSRSSRCGDEFENDIIFWTEEEIWKSRHFLFDEDMAIKT